MLEIGQPASSSTVDCTIQSSCVNYALTKKCIKYHNDQWFIVNSGDYDHLYINVQDQECRDLFGVQLVAIEGEACDIDNYKILTCVSLSSNDNFYVRLDSLKPWTNYLLNIDGYLHDFCSFEITADTVPYGIPPEVNLVLENDGVIDSSIVNINWKIPKPMEGELLFFEVMERSEAFKHDVIATIPVQRNTYGEIIEAYSFTDTLTDNKTHYYKLLAANQIGQRFLVGEYEFKGQVPDRQEYITITLGYPKETSLSLSIYDKKSNRIFRRTRFYFDPLKHSRLVYNVKALLEDGVETIIVEVRNNKTNEVSRKEYDLQ